MREVVYHCHAVRYMKRMPADRKEQVKAAVLEVAGLPDVGSHPNAKAMRGEWDGCFRLAPFSPLLLARRILRAVAVGESKRLLGNHKVDVLGEPLNQSPHFR